MSQVGLPIRPTARRDITTVETQPQPPAVAFTPVQLGRIYATHVVYFWKLDTISVINPPLVFQDGQVRTTYRNDPAEGAPLFSTTHGIYGTLTSLAREVHWPANTWYPRNFQVNKDGRKVGTITTTIDEAALTRLEPSIRRKCHFCQFEPHSEPKINSNFALRIEGVDQEQILSRQLIRLTLSYLLVIMNWASNDVALSRFQANRRFWQVDRDNPKLYGRMVLSNQPAGAPATTVADMVTCVLMILQAQEQQASMGGFLASCSRPERGPWMTLLATTVRPDPGPPGHPGPNGDVATA